MRVIFAVVALVITAAPAAAVDFSQPILDDEGKPICTLRGDELKAGEECPTDKVFTLGFAARAALYSNFADEQNISGEERAKRGDLARDIRAATARGDFKLKVEDLALIKKLIGKAYGPMVVSGAWRLLDPPAEKGSK